MTIQPNGAAPYAPPSAVLELLAAVRERDLPTPYSPEVVIRAGVTEALAPRVIKALKLYDLVDDDGNPTEQLHDLAKAGESDYPARLADVIRAAYADVLRYVDPATAPLDKIQDQFRSYTPRGQRERMVTLFLGMCEFTGLAPARQRESKEPASAPRKPRAQQTSKQRPKRKEPKTPPPPPPPSQSGRERYLDLLLKKVEDSEEVDDDLLNRIERVLGVASETSATESGGDPDT